MDSLDFTSLVRGDRIAIGGKGYHVTATDRTDCGFLVELKSGQGKTVYTLMSHAKQDGKYVLSTSRTNRVIDGWRKLGKVRGQ